MLKYIYNTVKIKSCSEIQTDASTGLFLEGADKVLK